MVELGLGRSGPIAPLFSDAMDPIIFSYLQGHMGRAWADAEDAPTCARIALGEFQFLAGDAGSEGAFELVALIPEGARSMTFVAQSPEWEPLIGRAYAGRVREIERVAFARDASGFDAARLRGFVGALPEGYEIEPIGEARLREFADTELMLDWVSPYDDAGDYLRRSIGFCALYGGELVGGVSSLFVYDGGAEVEIDVASGHRRRGVGAALAATFILECRSRGLFPSWDAANATSARLAARLGYCGARPYRAYQVDFEAEDDE